MRIGSFIDEWALCMLAFNSKPDNSTMELILIQSITPIRVPIEPYNSLKGAKWLMK